MNKKLASGQIALIVLLVMVVLLTVGLAVVSRSITDIRISEEAEESARAFSAAEAGIEEALKQDLSLWAGGEVAVGELTAEVTVTKTNSFETKIEQDETAEVNLNDYSGEIQVSWTGEGLVLALIYPEGGSYKVSRWALRPSDSTCGENFESLSPAQKTISIPLGSGQKVLRLRPVCGASEVKVTGSNPLPDQSYKIHSKATTPEGQTRAIELTKSFPILPPIFDFVLLSGGSLSK